MIDINLIALTNQDPIALASHAAKTCYNSIPPEMGDLLADPYGQLWEPGHHTTWQHWQATFAIAGIDVSNMKFGLHLVNRFYNSDEMSGRYCADMFKNPDFEAIAAYIMHYWPEINENQLSVAMNFVRKSTSVFHENIDAAAEVTAKLLKEERPHIGAKALKTTSEKVAQEQMRMFISMIFPTGLDHSLNLTALAAMYQAAWTPVVKDVTERAVKLVVAQYPELEKYYDLPRREGELLPVIPEASSAGVMDTPSLRVRNFDIDWDKVEDPRKSQMHPVDLLHFLPEMMNNSTTSIRMEIEISAATMGQDQRHRTINRSMPEFTGNFYMPVVIKEMGLEDVALETIRDWLSLPGTLPDSLVVALAPYGAMVRYQKCGNLNAIAHEQGKRLCFCAQEEIYNLGRLLLESCFEVYYSPSQLLPLSKYLRPPCYDDGKCAEGKRYCGRNLKASKPNDYFPVRKV
ncbi:MAG: FAD-dependent thymidylate synthase [Patescibacteria group bacterium]